MKIIYKKFVLFKKFLYLHCKPNYTNRDFMNIVIVFQSAMMDKLFDVMDFDGMKIEDRLLMAEKCGIDLKDFIFKYTNIDTHKIENYL